MSESAEFTALEYSPLRFWLYRLMSPFSTRVVGYTDDTATVEVSPRMWHPAYWWFLIRGDRRWIDAPVEIED